MNPNFLSPSLLAKTTPAYPTSCGKQSEADFVSHLCAVLDAHGYVQQPASKFNPTLGFDAEMLCLAIERLNPKQFQQLQARHSAPGRLQSWIAEKTHHAIKDSSLLTVFQKGLDLKNLHIRLHSGTSDGLLFSYAREVHYTTDTANNRHLHRIDLVIFCQGLPLFTFEAKYADSGYSSSCASYEAAIQQYKSNRQFHSDADLLLHPLRGALAHFALDQRQCWYTTHLQGNDSEFLPFNIGKRLNASRYDSLVPNPEPTSETNPLRIPPCAKSPVLEFVNYIPLHILQPENLTTILLGFCNQKNNRTLFPRIHQLRAISTALRHLEKAGNNPVRFLFNHSAGSGKSLTIAWLAKFLIASKNFDYVIVLNTRTVLDSQIARTLDAVYNAADQSSQAKQVASTDDLEEFLSSGKKPIIVSTLQKFSRLQQRVIENLDNPPEYLKNKRIAMILDEAHMGQTGATQTQAGTTLAGTVATANEEETDETSLPVLHDRLSYFAFTATPTEVVRKTFGEPIDEYLMVQAIAEGMTLNPVANYICVVPKVHAEASDQVDMEAKVARMTPQALYNQISDLHPYIAERTDHIMGRLQALNDLAAPQPTFHKAVALLDSRKNAAIQALYLNKALKSKSTGPVQRIALVAFSGSLQFSAYDLEHYTELQHLGILADHDYTETQLNDMVLPSKLQGKEPADILTALKKDPTAAQLANPASRDSDAFWNPQATSVYPLILCLANKYQVGFDEPDLCQLFLCKKVTDANAVQALSRINRRRQGKSISDICVYDYAGMVESIDLAFKAYGLSVGQFDPATVYEDTARIWSKLKPLLNPDWDEQLPLWLAMTDVQRTERTELVAKLYLKVRDRSKQEGRRSRHVNDLLARFLQAYSRLRAFPPANTPETSALLEEWARSIQLLVQLRRENTRAAASSGSTATLTPEDYTLESISSLEIPVYLGAPQNSDLGEVENTGPVPDINGDPQTSKARLVEAINLKLAAFLANKTEPYRDPTAKADWAQLLALKEYLESNLGAHFSGQLQAGAVKNLTTMLPGLTEWAFDHTGNPEDYPEQVQVSGVSCKFLSAIHRLGGTQTELDPQEPEELQSIQEVLTLLCEINDRMTVNA